MHDRLEKEIAPEVVRVDVVTREDEWGLKSVPLTALLPLRIHSRRRRLLNTIVSLDSLLRDGMAVSFASRVPRRF